MSNQEVIVHFEPHYQKRVLSVGFDPHTHIKTKEQIRELRTQWTNALQSWHSPYTALINLEHLTLDPSPELKEEWERFFKFLRGFFLKKALAYGHDQTKGHGILPFEFFTEEEALKKSGLTRQRVKSGELDLRSAITLENHFQQHVIELDFACPVTLKTKEDVQVLKEKLTNNLMQWHSPWNLLIHCQNLTLEPEATTALKGMLKIFTAFFLKNTIGYGQKASDQYPFPTYRSRHLAVSQLESEGLTSGDSVQCQSRK